MHLQSEWKEALSTVDADNDLNESNVIDKIKEKLKAVGQSEYERWKKVDFDLVYLLHKAVRGGSIKIVSALIEKGADVNAVDEGVYTPPLLAAVERGHIEMVNTLIEKGADVNVESVHLGTPLNRAVERCSVEIVKSLVEKGADVHAVGNSGYPSLGYAIRESNAEIVKFLVEKGADVHAVNVYSGHTLLHCAAKHGNAEIVKFLVEKGADVTCAVFGEIPVSFCRYQRPDAGVGEILIRHTLTKNPKTEKPNFSIGKLLEYWDRCLDELKKMQKEKIDDNVTFYDILTSKDENKLARYIRNKNIVEVLEESDYKSEFPVYAGEIENQYQKGIKRENLLNEGTARIQNSDIGGKLPEEICRKVAKYLSNTDIQKLNDSASVFRRPS